MTVECDCKKGQEFANGSKPEFYKDLAQALDRFNHFKNLNRVWALFDQGGIPIPPQYSRHLVERALYWSVHINGKHITAVKYD